MFRHAMIFPEANASAAQCESLLHLAVEACEHYYPAFQFVLWGGKTRRGSGGRGASGVRRSGVTRPILLGGRRAHGRRAAEGWVAEGSRR